MGNLGPEEDFRDTVHRYNDEVRWSRLAQAADMVAPAMRITFRRQHADFGKDIQVADVELTFLRMDKDADTALSKVRYRYYDQRAMMLQEAIVLQKWRHLKGNFLLTEEKIVEGDTTLFVAEKDDALDEPVAK